MFERVTAAPMRAASISNDQKADRAHRCRYPNGYVPRYTGPTYVHPLNNPVECPVRAVARALPASDTQANDCGEKLYTNHLSHCFLALNAAAPGPAGLMAGLSDLRSPREISSRVRSLATTLLLMPAALSSQAMVGRQRRRRQSLERAGRAASADH